MNFKVRFWSEKKRAIHIDRTETGLRAINLIRNSTGINVSLDKISENINGYSEDPLVEISELTAVNSGHFDWNNIIEVKVDPCTLNAFCRWTVSTEEDEQTHEIMSAKVKQWLDVDALIWWWADKGYPKNLAD